METVKLNLTVEPEHWEAVRKLMGEFGNGFLKKHQQYAELAKEGGEKAAYYKGQSEAFKLAFHLMAYCKIRCKEQETEQKYYEGNRQADIDDGVPEEEIPPPWAESEDKVLWEERIKNKA